MGSQVVNLALFVLQYPEFSQVDTVKIQTSLNRAANRMGGPNLDIWGSFATPGQAITQADEAQGAYAAALLAGSPYGFETRLAPGDGTNSYENQYLVLRDARGIGFVVAGGSRSVGRCGPGFGWPGL